MNSNTAAKRHASGPRARPFKDRCSVLSNQAGLRHEDPHLDRSHPPPHSSCECWLRCPFSPEAGGHLALQMALHIKCFQTQTLDRREGQKKSPKMLCKQKESNKDKKKRSRKDQNNWAVKYSIRLLCKQGTNLLKGRFDATWQHSLFQLFDEIFVDL